jgi:hypothetical protein
MMRGAAAALRRRADRQEKLVKAGDDDRGERLVDPDGRGGYRRSRFLDPGEARRRVRAGTVASRHRSMKARATADASSSLSGCLLKQDGLLKSAGGVEWLPRQGGEAPAPSFPRPREGGVMSLGNIRRLRESDIWPSAKVNRRRPSEGELADTLAERHRRDVRFLTAARNARWIVWDGEEWLFDTTNVAQRRAREICPEAAAECDDPAVDSNRVGSGVLSLAKCDPRLVCADWPCDPHIEEAVAGWVSDHCILAAEEWTPRADLLASFVGWEQFCPDDLMSALEAHGITYRRKVNSHGFNGVRLKGGEGD